MQPFLYCFPESFSLTLRLFEEKSIICHHHCLGLILLAHETHTQKNPGDCHGNKHSIFVNWNYSPIKTLLVNTTNLSLWKN